MQDILLMLAFGIITGLSIGRKIAIKEVEMLIKKQKAGLLRGDNPIWRNVRDNLKINCLWRAVKHEVRAQSSWRNTKNKVDNYDSDARRVWYELRDGHSRRKGRYIGAYLTGKTSASIK